MQYLSPDETRVLRITLGLHATARRAKTQNYLPPQYAEELAVAVASLVKRGYLLQRTVDAKRTYGIAPAGTYAATPAGIVAVMDEPWK